MAKKIVRPIKGMDLDSAPNRVDDNKARLVRNLRINNQESNKTGEYTNIKGINKAVYVPQGKIVGTTKVSEYIVLIIQSQSGNDFIARISEDDIPKQGEGILTLNTDDYYWNSSICHKVFEGDLNLLPTPLEVKSYFESESVQRIYWTDIREPLRSLNIIKTDSNDPSSLIASDLDIIPNADLNAPEITGTTSGSLLSGKIYYSYLLSNSNGAETALSELSKPYHLTDSSESSSSDYEYKGSGLDENTGKGIRLSIHNGSSNFTKAKVYSIHFVDSVSSPVIGLIYDGAANSDLTVVDTGVALEEITPEEYYSFSKLLIQDGKLSIKNNRLFAANYNEEFFDIDEEQQGGYWESRAYRFNDSTTRRAYLFEKDLVSFFYIDATTLDWDLVSHTHDCINKSNSTKYTSSALAANQYYKAVGSDMGAQGANITITQGYSTNSVHPDWAADSTKWYAPKTNSVSSSFSEVGYSSYANPAIASKYRSFKPEEVYRLSIQFRNSKQQKSYPKWICDYKVAYDNENDKLIDSYAGPYFRMAPITLSFEVSNIPDDPETDEPYEYRIMYVPVTDVDQSVTWGLFTTMDKNTTSNEFTISQLDRSFSGTNIGKYTDFISPDYCIGINKDYYSLNAYKSCANSNVDYFSDEERKFHVGKVYDLSEITPIFEKISSQYDTSYSSDIESTIPLDSSDIASRNIDVKYYGTDFIERDGRGNKGRSQILYPENPIGEDMAYFGCCYTDIFESQYGGISYEARVNSGYIALNDFGDGTSSTVYGDSYLGAFEYLRIIAENAGLTTDDGDKIGSPEVMIFPSVSRINLNLRNDDMFTKIYTSNGSYMIHEYAGVYEDSSQLNNEDNFVFTQEQDMYLYNMTYSREQDLVKYTSKQTNVEYITNFENRIIASEKKILGEQSDSFLKFGTSTYIDVDGQYGEIKRLIVFKDNLYFFQEKAVGIASVSERSATSQTDGSSLVIGELGVLSRYDYITKEYGISESNHVVAGDNAIYFIDNIRKELLGLSQNGLVELSSKGHVGSFVKETDFESGYMVFNRKYNEIVFAFRQSGAYGSQDSLVFNETSGAFSHFSNINVESAFSERIDRVDFLDEIIVEIDGWSSYLHSFNDGQFNNYNGSYVPSEIQLVFNPGQEEDVLFNVVEFIANQSDDGFIDTIRFHNDNYDTGLMDVSTATESKFGKFRTSKLRGYVIPGNKERILDNHLILTITTKDNSSAQSRVYFRDFIINYSQYNHFG